MAGSSALVKIGNLTDVRLDTAVGTPSAAHTTMSCGGSGWPGLLLSWPGAVVLIVTAELN